ncbi:MAG: cell division protein FtsZ, partial [Clostridiales bacterium]|nr:cell division protein FtsZ [Clostridiales bacterium]
FADVTSVMLDAGYAHMGIGEASGKDKANEAARAAITSPLLETTITGAKGVLVAITASPDIALEDITIASELITSEADEDAVVIWGAAFDETLEDTMKVTIIATGFQNKSEMDKTFVKKDTLRPIASGKTVGGKTEINVVGKGVQKPSPRPAQKPETKEEEGDSPISDEDFNEILKMLNVGKSQNNGANKY